MSRKNPLKIRKDQTTLKLHVLHSRFFDKSIQYEQEQNTRLGQHYTSILHHLIWHEDFMGVHHNLPRKTSRFHFTKRQKLKPKTKERTPDFI